MTETYEEAKKRGKKSRAAGKAFELKVRKDLEEKGWIVFKNPNQVTKVEQTEIGEFERFFKQCKPIFNPFTKSLMMNSGGFPDFICIKEVDMFDLNAPKKAQIKSLFGENTKIGCEIKAVIFVECKAGDYKHKYLDSEEKEKVKWINEKLKIPVILANKGEKRGEIIYVAND